MKGLAFWGGVGVKRRKSSRQKKKQKKELGSE